MVEGVAMFVRQRDELYWNQSMTRLASEVYRRIGIALAVVIGLGLLSRAIPLGFVLWDKYLGDALYAAAVYLGLSLIGPQSKVKLRGALAATLVCVIELFQLTGIPAQLNQSENLLVKAFAYLVLGSAFSPADLVAYGAGLLALIVVDEVWLRTEVV
jgi:uncharacterized protein YjeT (DUF2065 family)